MKKIYNSKRLTLFVTAISFYFVAYFIWEIAFNKVELADLSDSEIMFNLLWLALLIANALNYRRIVRQN